jgi:hypothetical protein
MAECGEAIALLGNHEMDVLMHDTPDGVGGWLRPHGGRNSAMHARTHAEFAERPEEWREWLGWFRSLPLFLEMPGFCAVHACWDEAQAFAIRDRWLDDAFLHAVADRASLESIAARKLLHGPEVPLPFATPVTGSDGRPLTKMRVRWWRDGRGDTYRRACICRHHEGPEIPVPAEFDHLLAPPAMREKRPVFVGHYWLAPGSPAPLTPTLACLDYSIAAGGPLAAYRWDGERLLDPGKFVFQTRRARQIPDATAAAIPP